MKRKLIIAQMLLAQSEVKSIKHSHSTEEGHIYDIVSLKGKSYKLRIRPGGTIAVQKGDEWKTIDLEVPYDIVNLQETSMNDFHISLKGWLGDSRKLNEELS